LIKDEFSYESTLMCKNIEANYPLIFHLFKTHPVLGHAWQLSRCDLESNHR